MADNFVSFGVIIGQREAYWTLYKFPNSVYENTTNRAPRSLPLFVR